MSGVRVPHRPLPLVRGIRFRRDVTDMLGFVKKYIRRSAAWRRKSFRKTERLIHKLRKQGLSEEQVADYFLHDNLSRKEKKFCPLFADGKKCHILSGDRLNCLGCYCPYFSAEVNEKDGFIECGLCTVSSPAARRAVSAKNPKLTVLDCSMCVIPHQHSRVWEILNRDFPRANG